MKKLLLTLFLIPLVLLCACVSSQPQIEEAKVEESAEADIDNAFTEEELEAMRVESISFSLKEGSLSNEGATFVLANNGAKDIKYSAEYILQDNDGEQWRDITFEHAAALYDKTVSVGESVEWVADWGPNGGLNLSEGRYRVIIKLLHPAVWLAAEFELK